jgi:hypothetical protein
MVVAEGKGGLRMRDKLNVTVDENKRKTSIQVGRGMGLCHVIEIDLTDSKSIVDGIVAAISANAQLIEARPDSKS